MTDYLSDLLYYGISIHKTMYRKWYNPMRWIKGKEYLIRISPNDFYL